MNRAGFDGPHNLRHNVITILGVARRYGQACSSEIEFLRDALPEAGIERVQHMIAGQHACSYEIKPRPIRPQRAARSKRR